MGGFSMIPNSYLRFVVSRDEKYGKWQDKFGIFGETLFAIALVLRYLCKIIGVDHPYI